MRYRMGMAALVLLAISAAWCVAQPAVSPATQPAAAGARRGRGAAATGPAGARTPVRVPRGFAIDSNVHYDKYDSTILDVMWPTADPGPAKRPGVIVFHGGGWIESTKETTMNSLCTPYLNQGFVVCNVEYRVAKEGLAPAAVNDALDAARWFYDRADHYGFDPKRLVVTGASAGGHLALMVGMTPESARLGPITPIAAIINGYGPPDVNDLLAGGAHHQSWADQWLGNQPDIQGLAKSLSPLTYVRPGLPACFTVQGSNDHTVPVPDNQKLTAALKAAGDDADMMLVPGAGHGFTTQWPQVNAQIFAFLRQRGIIQTAAPTTAAVSPSSQPATH